MADVNPYEAPASIEAAPLDASHAAWREPVARAALLVLAIDLGRSALWRITTAIGMAYPGTIPENVGPIRLNLLIQLVGALALVRAVSLLTTDPATAKPGPKGGAVRRFAIITLATHVVRLVVDVSGFVDASSWLGAITMFLDGAVVAAGGAYLATVFVLVGESRAAAATRLLAVLYLSAVLAAGFISASVTIRSLRVLPDTSRSLLTLFCLALAFAAFRLVKRLQRA